MKILVDRDMIQFESVIDCTCGNSHTARAAAAWRSAIENLLRDHEAEAYTHHRPDHCRYDVVIWDDYGNRYARYDRYGKVAGYPPEIRAVFAEVDLADDRAIAAARVAVRSECSTAKAS